MMKSLGRSIIVVLRRPFYREGKKETCGRNGKCNGLGSADERWNCRELKQCRKGGRGLQLRGKMGLQNSRTEYECCSRDRMIQGAGWEEVCNKPGIKGRAKQESSEEDEFLGERTRYTPSH